MRRKILGLVVLLILFVAGFWGIAGAQSFRSGNATSVGADENIDSSLWISGRTIDIAGEVNGDVFCAGQNVTISGSVRGDVLCAAQTIVISGEVGGDVRIAAQTATLSGAVVSSVSAATQSFTQGSKSAIGDDVSVASGDASFSGTIGRDAAIGAKTINLNGQIGRNVEASTGSLSLGGQADIRGDLSYTSEKSAKFASGANVQGETSRSAPKKKESENAAQTVGTFLGPALYFLAAALLITLVLVLLFPQAFHAITAQGLKMPWKALLVGLVTAIAIPVLIVLLMLTVVGIPLALLLLFAWIILQTLAITAAAYLLGRVVWRNQRSTILTMLVGTVLFVILLLVPIIDVIVYFLAAFLGIGMTMLELNKRRPKPRYNLDPRPANTRATPAR